MHLPPYDASAPRERSRLSACRCGSPSTPLRHLHATATRRPPSIQHTVLGIPDASSRSPERECSVHARDRSMSGCRCCSKVVECCAKIAMTTLRTLEVTMRLLSNHDLPRLIFLDGLALPRTRSVLLDSGHFVSEDRAEDYAAAILGWISRASQPNSYPSRPL